MPQGDAVVALMAGIEPSSIYKYESLQQVLPLRAATVQDLTLCYRGVCETIVGLKYTKTSE